MRRIDLFALALERPKDELDDRGQYENGRRVIAEEAVQRIERVEQDLADDFEDAEIHDFRFGVLQLRQAMIELRPDVELELQGCRLAG